MPELWQPIEGYEGLYEVSDQGRVKTLRLGREVSYTLSNSGYRQVDLYDKKGRDRRYVHRLVAEHFLNGPRLKEVNHKDGVKTNNAVSNLEWASRRENFAHAKEKGFWSPPPYRVSTEHWQEMLELARQGWSQQRIAEKFETSQQNVSRYLKRLRAA